MISKTKYLGIWVTNNANNLFKDNYIQAWKEIKKELETWNRLNLSLLGRIATIKMNILPKMLFLFQMIPILGTCTTIFKQWKKQVTKFVWNYKPARFKYKLLIDIKDRGGLALPDLELYHDAAGFLWLKEWILLENHELLDLEGFENKFGWHAYLVGKKEIIPCCSYKEGI